MSGSQNLNRSISSEKLETRQATKKDLLTLAKIHKQAYSKNHFTALLPDEVLVHYYNYFLGQGTEIALVVQHPERDVSSPETEAEEILGFAVYGVGIPKKIALFKQEFFKEILLSSLRHPWTAGKKFLSALYSKLINHTPYPPTDFLLLSIAAQTSGLGVGKKLLNHMIDTAQEKKYPTIGLYVNANNIHAINTYFSTSFFIVSFENGQFYMERKLS